MKLINLFNFFLLLSLTIATKEMLNICKPDSHEFLVKQNESDISNINENNEYNCNCDEKLTSPFSKLAIYIECRDKELNNKNFKGEILPFGTINLDMSWNNFEYVPTFISNELIMLIISNNNIKTIDDHNFINLPNLKILDLSLNQLIEISINSFENLNNLEKLDLSKNSLKILHSNIFSTLPMLSHLILNDNYLNETFNKQKDINLFLTLGVTPKLQILEMEHCQLIEIDIKAGAGLEQIFFKFNNFTSVPELPTQIELLDLSGNPIEILTPKFLSYLYKLRTLLLQDMPLLRKVEEYSLFGLPRLSYLNFQGSKSLTNFDPYAFGHNAVLNETDTALEILNFRGANLRTLNSSMKFVIDNIKTLDLDGNPLLCDCEIKWILALNIETNGQCMQPTSLRGKMLSSLSEERLECKRWSTSWWYKILNGLFVLLLLIVSGAAIYLIVLWVKPSNRIQLRKLSAASPYARITIEPRAEM